MYWKGCLENMSDVTKEKAIEVLKDLWRYEKSNYSDEWVRKALDMAIEALEQEPCEDYVSRQAVLEIFGYVMDYWKEHAIDVEPHEIEDAIIEQYTFTAEELSKLPLVTPQTKVGHWIAQNIHNCHTDFKCSKCGYVHNFLHLYGEPTADYPYCPNCGAKMEGE